MSGFKISGIASGVGAAVGGLGGFIIGGPTGAWKGAQAGWLLGLQVAGAHKAEEVVDEGKERVFQGVDKAGEQVVNFVESAEKKWGR